MQKFIILVLISVAMVACKKPQVAQLGTPITEGEITFKVQDYDIRIVEVSEDNKTFGYARPVLAIPVEIKNAGSQPYSYLPTHKTQQMSEASTPLLYVDPGKEAALPPESKSPIMGIYLQKGTLEDQITDAKTIAAGESITDTFLFQVPDAQKNLVLSLPPTMHRGTLPVLVRIPFTPRDATGPKIHKMGDAVKFGKVEFAVTNAYFENVKSKHATQGKGKSTDKLMKIDYTIVNKGKDAILFDPAHRDLSGKGANLFGDDRAYKRVKFSPSVEVINQLADVMKIQPGESVTDFVLFDVKQADFNGATFEYPANLFSKDGVARFNITLTEKSPEETTPKPVEKVEEVKTPTPDAGSAAKPDAGSAAKPDTGKKE